MKASRAGSQRTDGPSRRISRNSNSRMIAAAPARSRASSERYAPARMNLWNQVDWPRRTSSGLRTPRLAARSKIRIRRSTVSGVNMPLVSAASWTVYAARGRGTMCSPWLANRRTHMSKSIAFPASVSNGPAARYASALATSPGRRTNDESVSSRCNARGGVSCSSRRGRWRRRMLPSIRTTSTPNRWTAAAPGGLTASSTVPMPPGSNASSSWRNAMLRPEASSMHRLWFPIMPTDGRLRTYRVGPGHVARRERAISSGSSPVELSATTSSTCDMRGSTCAITDPRARRSSSGRSYVGVQIVSSG